MPNPLNLEALDKCLWEILSLIEENAQLPGVAEAVRKLAGDYESDEPGENSLFDQGWLRTWANFGVFANRWILQADGLDKLAKDELTGVGTATARFLVESVTPVHREEHARELSAALRKYLALRGYHVPSTGSDRNQRTNEERTSSRCRPDHETVTLDSDAHFSRLSKTAGEFRQLIAELRSKATTDEPVVPDLLQAVCDRRRWFVDEFTAHPVAKAELEHRCGFVDRRVDADPCFRELRDAFPKLEKLKRSWDRKREGNAPLQTSDEDGLSLTGGIAIERVVSMITARLVSEAPSKISASELARLRRRLDSLRYEKSIETGLRDLFGRCSKAADAIGKEAMILAAEGCRFLVSEASIYELVHSDFLQCDIKNESLGVLAMVDGAVESLMEWYAAHLTVQPSMKDAAKGAADLACSGKKAPRAGVGTKKGKRGRKTAELSRTSLETPFTLEARDEQLAPDAVASEAAPTLADAVDRVAELATSVASRDTKQPEAPSIEVECWESLGIGIDEDRAYLAVTPCPDYESVFPKKIAIKLELPGDRWKHLLELLAESENGNTATKSDVMYAFGYLDAGSVSEANLEELKGDSATMQRIDRARRLLTGAVADLGRGLRKQVAVKQSEGDAVLSVKDKKLVRSRVVVRHLIREQDGKLRFGRRPLD